MNTPAPLHYETAQSLTRAQADTYTTINIPISKSHAKSLLRGLGWTETQTGYWSHPSVKIIHGDEYINIQRSIEIVLLSIAIANAG